MLASGTIPVILSIFVVSLNAFTSFVTFKAVGAVAFNCFCNSSSLPESCFTSKSLMLSWNFAIDPSSKPSMLCLNSGESNSPLISFKNLVATLAKFPIPTVAFLIEGIKVSPISTERSVTASFILLNAPSKVSDSLSVLPAIPTAGSCNDLINASLNSGNVVFDRSARP